MTPTTSARSPHQEWRVAPSAAVSMLAVFAWLLAPRPLWAQPHVEAVVAGTAVGWSASTTPREDGTAQSGTATAEYRFAEGRGRVFYEVDAGTFTTPGEWGYAVQGAGAVYRFEPSATNRLFAGGSASWRANGASWDSADYQALSAFLNVEAQPRPTASWRTGYRVDWRRFPDLAAMDQVEHSGFASVLVNLPSRTTLIGEAHVGGKTYGGGLTSVEYSSPAGLVQSGQGTRRGMGPSLRPRVLAGLHAVTAQHPDIQAGQVTWFARVAQSLADRLAVQAEASQRVTFGEVAPAVISTPEMYFDDGVYDDPYASDAVTWRLGLKRVFASGGELTAGTTWFDKDYTGTPALDASGQPGAVPELRSDEVWRVGVDVKVPLWPSRTGTLDLALVGGYLYTRSSSNDAFYTYRSHGLTVGLSMGY